MSAPNSLQTKIKEQLLLNPYFSAPREIPMLADDEGEIVNDAATRKTFNLDGGVGILISVPFGENAEPEKRPVLLNLMVEIFVLEKTIINRSAAGIQKTAYALLCALCAPYQPDNAGGLHGWNPKAPFTRLELQSISPVEGEFKINKTNQVVKADLAYRALFVASQALS